MGLRPIGGLQVNRRKVPSASDPLRSHLPKKPVAMDRSEALAQTDDVDKPADTAARQFDGRKFQLRMILQPLVITAGDRFTPLENRFHAFELLEAKGAIQFRDSIIEAQLFMLEPFIRITPPLIS